jgi:hypothetical protein
MPPSITNWGKIECHMEKLKGHAGGRLACRSMQLSDQQQLCGLPRSLNRSQQYPRGDEQLPMANGSFH